MPWAPDQNGQWQWYASPLLAPQAGAQPGQESFNQDPTGTGPAQGDPTAENYGQPITTHYNPMLSGTADAAQGLAAKLGGTVVSAPMREAGGGTAGSPWGMPDANYIKLPNGTIENAGQLLQWAGQFGEDSQQFKTMVAQTQSHQDQQNPIEADWWAQNAQPVPSSAAPASAPAARAPEAPPAAAPTSTAPARTPPSAFRYGGGYTAAPEMADPSVASRDLPRPTSGRTDGGLPPSLGGPGATPLPAGGRPMPTGPATPPTTTPPTPITPPVTTPPGGRITPPVTPPTTPGPGNPATPPLPSGRIPPVTPPATPPVTPKPVVDPAPPSGNGPVSKPGGYGIGYPAPMSGGNGALGPGEWNFNDTNNVQDVLANDRKFAYGQGQKLIANYGDSMAAQDQRARQLGSVGDDLYSWMLEHPGYTPEQAKAIMNGDGPGGLKSLRWTDQMANSNFLDQDEQAAMKGDPNRALDTYNGSAENLRQDARNYQGGLTGIYDQGATDLNTATGQEGGRLDTAIDPAQLGLSDTYKTQHQFGPEDQQALIEDAGRTVGQGTAAVTDDLQRKANAAGTNAPLAMSAALDRQRQTGAVASADAMTKAKIQAAQLGLATGQQTEQTRLGAEQDISSRRMDAAKTLGSQDAANQQFLTGGRASAGLATGKAALDESNRIAEQQTGLAGTAEIAQQQRAQAIAQNRQTVNQANQGAQFTRGSYEDQARSQRETQGATAARNDLTAARQDVRNEEQTADNESNSRMAGQLQAFGATTGAGQASQQNAITAAQMPSTIQKIVGGLVSGAGQTSYGEGGVATEPTMARLGELGPEIVIKLKPSRPMSYQRKGEMANAA